jgi:outer membrane protein
MKRIYIFGAIVWGLSFLGMFLLVSYQPKSRTVYLRLPEVFESFSMKKEYEASLHREIGRRERVIDSLRAALANDRSNKLLETELADSYRAFEREKTEMVENLDRQIFRRINQYLEIYAAEKGYDYILGADGSGVIMAADSSLDITVAVIDFINEKYEGN